MEKETFPKFSGDAEGCSSSESGWTMYLASSMHGDSSNGDDDDDDDDDGGGGNGNIGEGKEDDDSMASDASSGTPCKKLVDYAICHDVKHGNVVCCDVGDDVVKEKSSKCSSRHSRKNLKVGGGDEKGILSEFCVQKEEKGESKMRRVKSSEK